jgi:four helix bundle protein
VGKAVRNEVVRSYQGLLVWQKAMELIGVVYPLAKRFPRSEIYGLTSQTTRVVVSVATNIAEGNSRGTRRDYAQFLSIAHGSLSEIETCLLVAVRVGYLREHEIEPAFALATEIGKMLTTLRSRVLANSTEKRT